MEDVSTWDLSDANERKKLCLIIASGYKAMKAEREIFKKLWLGISEEQKETEILITEAQKHYEQLRDEAAENGEPDTSEEQTQAAWLTSASDLCEEAEKLLRQAFDTSATQAKTEESKEALIRVIADLSNEPL